MSKEEPAWRRELGASIDRIDPYHTEDWLQLLEPHIRAAEQRGRQEALEKFVCGVCGHRAGWIECPTGGWWAHEVHPGDDHDAEGCTPESESP